MTQLILICILGFTCCLASCQTVRDVRETTSSVRGTTSDITGATDDVEGAANDIDQVKKKVSKKPSSP